MPISDGRDWIQGCCCHSCKKEAWGEALTLEQKPILFMTYDIRGAPQNPIPRTNDWLTDWVADWQGATMTYDLEFSHSCFFLLTGLHIVSKNDIRWTNAQERQKSRNWSCHHVDFPQRPLSSFIQPPKRSVGIKLIACVSFSRFQPTVQLRRCQHIRPFKLLSRGLRQTSTTKLWG